MPEDCSESGDALTDIKCKAEAADERQKNFMIFRISFEELLISW